MAEAIWLELGATETLADSAAMKMEKSQCLQTDLMDSPRFWERALYHTRASAESEAFQQWNISRPVLAVLLYFPCTLLLFSVPLALIYSIYAPGPMKSKQL